jgi:hypothetical protein
MFRMNGMPRAHGRAGAALDLALTEVHHSSSSGLYRLQGSQATCAL